MITEFGDYEEMYGSMDYEGKVVLDIGADYGTTATWFLEQGAKRVLVSEKNPEWYEQLVALAVEDPRIEITPTIDLKTICELLHGWFPQIVKVDCEGCEVVLLEVSPQLLTKPEVWVLETHTQMLYDELKERFRTLGYKVTIIKEYGPMKTNPNKVVNVFKAVRA